MQEGKLLTQDWQVASPMFYAQEIEQRRRDVKIVDVNLLRRSWYFDYLRRTHPGLNERSREKIEVFVENLRGMGARLWSFRQEPGADSKNQRGVFGHDSIHCDEREQARAGLHYE